MTSEFLIPSPSADPWLPVGEVPLPPSRTTGPATDSPQPKNVRLPRVLHVVNGEHFAGAERVQDLLALRLPEHGYEVEFACVKADRFPTARHSQVPLHNVSMRSRWDLHAAQRLTQLVKQRDFALLHAHTPRSLLVALPAARACQIPLVYHVHSPAARDSTRWWINQLNALIERWGLRNAAQLITVSESLAREMSEQGYAAERVAVVPNGVPAPSELPPRRAPQSPWVIGTMALFRPRKGTEILLAALGELRRAGRDVRLRAVGTFESTAYQQQIMACAVEHGVADWIEWVGFQRDINRQLAMMDLFVLPSLFGEGMPMVVLEAMAMGLPIVSTAVEGIPEVIRDGLDGRVVAAGDPQALATALGELVDDVEQWELLRQNVLDRHAIHFSDHSMAGRLAREYDRLLGATRNGGPARLSNERRDLSTTVCAASAAS